MDDTGEINQLIRELNLGGDGESRPESERLDGWLGTLVGRAGSDLLLVAGAPAAVRLDGRVTPLAEAPLSGEEIEDAVLPSLSSAARSRYLQDGAADASYKCGAWAASASTSIMSGDAPRRPCGRFLPSRLLLVGGAWLRY